MNAFERIESLRSFESQRRSIRGGLETVEQLRVCLRKQAASLVAEMQVVGGKIENLRNSMTAEDWADCAGRLGSPEAIEPCLRVIQQSRDGTSIAEIFQTANIFDKQAGQKRSNQNQDDEA